MRYSIIIASASILIACSGCQTLMEGVAEIGTTIGQATGTITAQEAESIRKTSSAVGKSFEGINPEQEYYVGRSLGAMILSSYKPYDNRALNEYLNTLGQTLATASDKPETFGGYHFLTLETDEINAFAAPGGLIFISRGLIKCCDSEDALAAVLAHEIGHVQLEHGLSAIKKSRWTGAVTTALAESAKSLGTEELANLTHAFEGALDDISQTLVNSGYARKFEYQADEAAVEILMRVGYSPKGLEDMLRKMDKLSKPGKGFAKTHPAPLDRLEKVQKLTDNSTAISNVAARKLRFNRAIPGI